MPFLYCDFSFIQINANVKYANVITFKSKLIVATKILNNFETSRNGAASFKTEQHKILISKECTCM